MALHRSPEYHVHCKANDSRRGLGLVNFGKKIIKDFSFWLPWQPEFGMDPLYLKNFCRGPCKNHSCQVSSKSVVVSEEMSFFKHTTLC